MGVIEGQWLGLAADSSEEETETYEDDEGGDGDENDCSEEEVETDEDE